MGTWPLDRVKCCGGAGGRNGYEKAMQVKQQLIACLGTLALWYEPPLCCRLVCTLINSLCYSGLQTGLEGGRRVTGHEERRFSFGISSYFHSSLWKWAHPSGLSLNTWKQNESPTLKVKKWQLKNADVKAKNFFLFLFFQPLTNS